MRGHGRAINNRRLKNQLPPTYFLGGRRQKRRTRTGLTLAYILGVGDNENGNGRT